jgi:hypothetical protein
MNKYILRCIGCVGSRAVIIYIAKTTWVDDLYFVGIFYIFVATHFTYNYFLDSEKTGLSVLKPIHAIIYLAFAYCAFRSLTNIAWTILVFDLGLGITAFTVKTFIDYRQTYTLEV